MERYNIFHLIHKGLRVALYHTSIQLQQTDFTKEDERQDAVNRVREITMLFDDHAGKEDGYILPAIVTYEPSVVTGFEAEHEKDEQLSSALRACAQRLEDAGSSLEQLLTGRELIMAFQEFTIFNLRHMACEEDVINKILWRYFSDEEIRLINMKIVASVAPWIQDFYATWILRGINLAEAAAWIKSIENTMPEVAFRTLLQKAEQELSKSKYQELTAYLSSDLAEAV